MMSHLFKIAVAVGVIAVATPGAFAQKHPTLHRTLYDLREARSELREAPNNFGGHKAKALEAIDNAIGQIEKILVKENDFNFKGKKDKNDTNVRPPGPFPNIRAAIGNLKEARNELRDAKTDFGGLKDNAIRDIDIAINQLELGMIAVVKKKN